MSALLSVGVICLLAIFASYSTSAQQTKGKDQPKAAAKGKANPRISYPGYIGGVVQGEKGPEAGVWVIAETNDTQTKMIKTVATDDQGRFVLPDLPAVNYKVWSRGYGIVDSAPMEMKPGTTPVTIKVTTAKRLRKRPKFTLATTGFRCWRRRLRALSPKPRRPRQGWSIRITGSIS
jgi:hypothetical protein